MYKAGLVVLCGVFSAAASAVPYRSVPPFSPLYETYNASLTDFLYSINYSAAYQSLSNGYSNLQTSAYLERTQQVGTSPLRRYWKGAPQNEHVYLTDDYPDEIANVLAHGYVAQGIDGYIYTEQRPGSVPYYRLNKFNGANGDLVHKYTSSETERATLKAQGWSDDHIAGWVPLTTVNNQWVNGFPYLTDGHVMTRRCQVNASCATSANFRDYYSGYLTRLSTTKPAGATRQIMTFDLWTPDYFGPHQNEHIAIGLHGKWDIDFSNIDNVSNLARNHHALGLIIGETGCGHDTVQVEAFWPTGNYTTGDCSAGANVLKNHVTYRFSIIVSDNGFISYTVTPADSRTPILSGEVNGNKMFPGSYPFPVKKTGYFMVPSTMTQHDYSIYMSNLNVSWSP